jgi:pentapeptide repeat protein
MANSEHIANLKAGVHAWNKWRKENPVLGEDLRRGGVKELEQYKIDLRHAQLAERDLRGFDLSFADLHRATLWRSDLSGANLEGADLSSVNLNFANLSSANLRGAILRFSRLAEADVSESTLSGSFVYASSIWNVKGQPKEQVGIVITPKSEPEITVDEIELAQFIFLLLSNPKIRQVIDTVTSRVVLILGRFTPERKVLLDRIREQLRKLGRVPILFDFEKPLTRTTDETITTLARMSRFVIADLTDAKSVLQELSSIVPNCPSVIVQPLLLASQELPGMWDSFRAFPWVLEPVRYTNEEELIATLDEKVIAPAEARALRSQSR